MDEPWWIMDEPWWIVQVYYRRSETTYTFGPFVTEEDLKTFLKRVEEKDDCDEPVVSMLNSPTLFGTGEEMSEE